MNTLPDKNGKYFFNHQTDILHQGYKDFFDPINIVHATPPFSGSKWTIFIYTYVTLSRWAVYELEK